jgi:ankyrin repeat protein
MNECAANIYERTNDGKTALMLAVYNNHRQVVESLLQHGASVYDNDVHGTSPLLMVIT